MSFNKKVVLAASVVPITVLLLTSMRRNRRKNRQIWARKWLQRRDQDSCVLSLVKNELRTEDSVAYKQFMRMCEPHFHELLDLISSEIRKRDTNMREAVSAEKRLMITLRYLATGESYRSLMFASRIHESTISIFVPEVCGAIYKTLKDTYIKLPTTKEEWIVVANAFRELWDFPLCMGAIDGKHINFRPPRSQGSYYYNYKGDHSIVLLAVADAAYKFLYVDVGVNGRVSDGGVYRESTLKRAMDMGILDFPNDETLSGTAHAIPYVFIADEAFPLSHRIVKPFRDRGLTPEKKIFNYRLSHARRVIENAFGIMANRFRILLTTIPLSPEKVETITLACCALHNYLISKSEAYSHVESGNLSGLVQIQGGNRPTTGAMETRDILTQYFNNNGATSWQNRCLLDSSN